MDTVCAGNAQSGRRARVDARAELKCAVLWSAAILLLNPILIQSVRPSRSPRAVACARQSARSVLVLRVSAVCMVVILVWHCHQLLWQPTLMMIKNYACATQLGEQHGLD